MLTKKEMDGKYQTTMSDNFEDPRWDAFVASVPGGHPIQTSLWSQLKASRGLRALRFFISEQENIVAGGQLLLHKMSRFGSIGYITKGPIVIKDDPVLFDLIIREIHRNSERLNLQYLVIQPPNNGHTTANKLQEAGFQISWIELTPSATIVIDLHQGLGQILAQMKRQTHQNIQMGIRNGVVVREGTKEDLSQFYRLYTSTSKRQRFIPYPEAYFSKMWDIFNPHGYIQVFVAEYKGEAVSMLLIISFGTSVTCKILGWSELRSECKPNQTLIWRAIQWAKSRNYRWFDFEGIDRKSAESIPKCLLLPKRLTRSPDFFKKGFGGQVVMYPVPYDYVYNQGLKKVYHQVSPWLRKWSVTNKKLLDLIRAG